MQTAAFYVVLSATFFDFENPLFNQIFLGTWWLSIFDTFLFLFRYGNVGHVYKHKQERQALGLCVNGRQISKRTRVQARSQLV